MLAPSNAALENVSGSDEDIAELLSKHILMSTRGYTPSLTDGANFVTLAGTTATVEVSADGSISVDGARIIIPDVVVKNGVIHVVDSVSLQFFVFLLIVLYSSFFGQK